MKKIDHKIVFKEIYTPRKGQIRMIDIPEMSFLMVDGQGHPNETMFQQAAQTLYTVAYTLKFMIREETRIDYRVMPMEVIWCLDRTNKQFSWTMMIMQPELVTPIRYTQSLNIVTEKKKDVPLQSQLRLSTYQSGRCVQSLHVGEYECMNETLTFMKDYGKAHGYDTEDDTHDIYLNDKRKTKPQNLKTIMLLKVSPNIL